VHFSAVIFDVDDVVINTDDATKRAIDSMPVRMLVRETFRHLYVTLISFLRGDQTPDYAPLMADIQRWQRDLTEIKIFSREVLMAVALQRNGEAVTASAVHGAVDHYWREVAAFTTVFSDAIAAFEQLRHRNVPFSFATNSDGFLILDEAAQSFRYDAAYNVERKRGRLSALTGQGIDARQITVGDPIGKPHEGFYRQAIEDHRQYFGDKLDLSHSLAIGDSLSFDVLPFLQAGVGHGAWLRRHVPAEQAFLAEHPNVAVISSLADMWDAKGPKP
jgi:FMN phosphatase YigB (HAD superfamily)